jgi:peptidoglycan/xylan/chitin deacetylase (PgdA/CDA1 family)
MMTTMPTTDPPDHSRTDRLRIAARAAVTAASLGFVLAASKNPHTDGTGSGLLILLALMAGLLAARRLPANRALAVAGGAVASTAAWLLPQRDDIGSAVILAVLFAVGAGIATEPPPPSRPARDAGLAAVVVMFALYFAASQDVLLVVVVSVVIAATAATAAGYFPTRASSRGRAIVFGTVLLATTLVLAGYIGAETPGATWFGGGIVHGPVVGGQVALTFDDGPNVGASEKIMAILDAHGVKGTFFQVGKAIDADPQITRALYDDGQLLGNHSYHHDQWRWLDPRYPELERTQAAFRRAIGICPVLYRPPHGDRTPFLAQVVRDHHMRMVLWSASAGDWATNDAQLVARRILAGARPGAILLLHDGLDGQPAADREVLVKALPIILDGLRDKGLSAVRLDRLLGTGDYQSC